MELTRTESPLTRASARPDRTVHTRRVHTRRDPTLRARSSVWVCVSTVQRPRRLYSFSFYSTCVVAELPLFIVKILTSSYLQLHNQHTQITVHRSTTTHTPRANAQHTLLRHGMR